MSESTSESDDSSSKNVKTRKTLRQMQQNQYKEAAFMDDVLKDQIIGRVANRKGVAKINFLKLIEASITPNHCCYKSLLIVQKKASGRTLEWKRTLEKSIFELRDGFSKEYEEANMQFYEKLWCFNKQELAILSLHADVEYNKANALRKHCSPVHSQQNNGSTKSSSNTNHADKLLFGDTTYLQDNCVTAVEGLPMSSCFIIRCLPLVGMHDLARGYGSDEYTRHFAKHSKRITTSEQDSRWGEQYVMCPPTTNDKDGRKKLFALSEKVNSEAEAKLIEEGLHSAHLADREADYRELFPPRRAGRPKKKICKTNPVVVPNPSVFAVDQESPEFKSMLELFTDNGIGADFLTEERSSYMMDAWSTSREKGDGDDTVIPNELHNDGLASQDSRLLNDFGMSGGCMMRNLVGRCLAIVLGKEFAAGPPGSNLGDTCTTPTDSNECGDSVHNSTDNDDDGVSDECGGGSNKSGPYGDIPFDIQNLGILGKSIPTYYDTGLIKTGTTAIHQTLHIDNKDILHNEIAHRVWLGKPVTPLELLRLGYVVDIPLSKEGSWIRIAVPHADKNKFVMHWIFVPLGCALVRNNSLWHNGNYGSPGNSRVHGTFGIEAAIKVDTQYIGYFSHLASVQEFKDWTLEWEPSLHHPLSKGPDGYRYITERWSAFKRMGTSYFGRKFIALNPESYTAILLNLNPSWRLKLWNANMKACVVNHNRMISRSNKNTKSNQPPLNTPHDSSFSDFLTEHDGNTLLSATV
jgi:hypothetical protein